MLCSALLLGCGNRGLRDSIKKMNHAIDQVNNGQLKAAEETLKESTILAKENHQAWYTLGQVYIQQKDYEKAIEALQNAIRYKEDDPMYHLLIAECYLESKAPNLSNAQTHLEQAVKLEDRLYRAHHLLGDVLDQRGQAQAAAERWTKAASIAPTSYGRPFNALGKLYIRWDFLNEAVAVLQAGIAKVTDNDQKSDLHYHLGLALSGQNKHQEAIAEYTKSIELRKGNMDAVRQRGYAYLAAGDKAKAKDELTAFVKGGGGSPFEVQTVNQTLFRLAVEEPTPPPTEPPK